MNGLEILKYTLFNYGIIVQRDARKEFVYDIAPPLGRTGDHRVIDLTSYLIYETWQDAVDALGFFLDEANPPVQLFRANFYGIDELTYEHYVDTTFGNTFFQVSPPSFQLTVSMEFVGDSFVTNTGEIVFHFEESEFPYGLDALPADTFNPNNRYSSYSITFGNDVNMGGGSNLNVTLPIPLKSNTRFVRLVGQSTLGPNGVILWITTEVPKLRGETRYEGPLSKP